MDDKHYPALYQVANGGAISAQRDLLNLTRWNSILLIAGAAVSLVSVAHAVVFIVAALLFGASLFTYIFGRVRNYHGKWYKARALAESVKTSTWKFMMRAEPYQDDQTAEAKFIGVLQELLEQNKDIGEQLSSDVSTEQITEYMLRRRATRFADRKDVYLKERIEEQKTWYAGKVKFNKNQSKKWFTLLCVAYGVAIVLVLLKIAYPNWEYVPTEVALVVASSIISWTQLKRFDELASAYSLTVQEIGIVHSRYRQVSSEQNMASFTSDAENVFSREHTQWAARRDT